MLVEHDLTPVVLLIVMGALALSTPGRTLPGVLLVNYGEGFPMSSARRTTGEQPAITPGADDESSETTTILPPGPQQPDLDQVVLPGTVVNKVVTELLRLSEDLVLDLARDGIEGRGDAFARVDMSARITGIVSTLLRHQAG